MVSLVMVQVNKVIRKEDVEVRVRENEISDNTRKTGNIDNQKGS